MARSFNWEEDIMTKLHKAALIRSYRTFLWALVGLIPAGATFNFVNGVDWVVLGLTILGMICTALVTAVITFLHCIIAGLPEVFDDDFNESELMIREIENSLTDKELGIDCGDCPKSDIECNEQCKESEVE